MSEICQNSEHSKVPNMAGFSRWERYRALHWCRSENLVKFSSLHKSNVLDEECECEIFRVWFLNVSKHIGRFPNLQWCTFKYFRKTHHLKSFERVLNIWRNLNMPGFWGIPGLSICQGSEFLRLQRVYLFS